MENKKLEIINSKDFGGHARCIPGLVHYCESMVPKSFSDVYGIGLTQDAFLLSHDAPRAVSDGVLIHMHKKLKKVSRDTLCSLYEAASFLFRRRKTFISSSRFHIDFNDCSSSPSSVSVVLNDNSLSYDDMIRNYMTKLVKNMVNNAIPLIVDGEPIHVEVDSSEDSIDTGILAINNLQSTFHKLHLPNKL